MPKKAHRKRPLKISKRIRAPLLILLAAALLVPGCALRKLNSPGATPVASVAAPITPHCSDRVDRAKTAGFVGGVLGTIAASLIGSPFLGVFYRTAGYVMGFASSSPKCPKADSPAESNGTVNKTEEFPSAAIVEEEL